MKRTSGPREATKAFWDRHEAIVKTFEAGSDVVAETIRTLEKPEETVIES